MKRYVWIWIISCLITIQKNHAQNFPAFRFSLLPPVIDLPASQVTTIYKDSRGLMWIGTENNGLLRFDGKKIKSFYNADPTKGISSNYIANISEDKQGWLWVSSLPGLYHIDPVSEKTEIYIHDENDSNSIATNNKPIAFTDSRGRTWVTSNKGLQLFNASTKKFSTYFIPPVANPAWQANAKGINMPFEDRQKRLWAGSAYGLYLIDTLTHSCIPYFTGSYLYVSGIIQDAGGQLWVSFWGGGIKKFYPETGKYTDFYKPGSIVKDLREWEDEQHKKWICFAGEYFTLLDPVSGKFTYYINGYEAGKIRGKAINYIYRDNEQRLWIMTDAGINIMDPHLQIFSDHPLLEQAKTFSSSITSVGLPSGYLQTKTGHLVSCWYDGYVYHFDNDWKIQQLVTKLSADASSAFPRVNNMQYDDDGNIWYGTDSGFVRQSPDRNTRYYLPADSFAQLDNRYAAHDLLKRTDGLYWARFESRGLYLFDPGKNIFYKNYRNQYAGDATCMKYDREGSLWLGTTAGLYHYNQQTDSFNLVPFYKTKTIFNQLYHLVYDMYFDEQNTGWVTTYYGLVKLLPKSGHVEMIKDPERGRNYAAYRILCDSTGILWIMCADGIHAYNTHTGTFRYFSASDGLPENFRGYQGLFNRANDSTFVTGSLNSIITFNPYKLNQNSIKTAVIFTDIMIDEKRSALFYNSMGSNQITVPPGTQKISIHFAMLNYTAPQQNRLYYRLNGENEAWIETRDGDINLLNLPAGDYKLEVKGCSNESVVSNAYNSMYIVVKPSWYQSMVFRIFSVLLLAIGLYAIIRRRIKSVKDAASLKQHISETEMAALKAQMSPHFMFNCINSIDAFIYSNDKYNATLYLNKFARLLRNILDSSKQNTVSLQQDMETLKLYIQLEELRNENKFKTSISIDSELESANYVVPPLIIQPFVENAIQHGLKNKDGNNGLLEISVKKVNDSIEYNIRDNGIGRAAAAQVVQNKEFSYGIQLSCDRIKLFNRETQASVDISDLVQDGKPAGTLVRAYLKYN
ncbi:MAG: two-component regulator propeller domain-containing protein [Ferruginibacter sp.]